jgi:orotidine-5'-phosphate decarboxylase
MIFLKKLAGAIQQNRSFLSIGLDPDLLLIPPGVSVLNFNHAIIKATSDLVCAYKLNLASYEAIGVNGLTLLKETIKKIPPNIPVIVDANQNDIGDAAKVSAKALYDTLGADACTVNPFLGFDSIEPFIRYQDKGVFILCRTFNKGSSDFQSLRCQTDTGTKLFYEIVAEKAFSWNQYGNIGLVIGATYPEELAALRNNYPEMPFLIPGVGPQGGALKLTVQNGMDSERKRMIINSSRHILYASCGKDYVEAAHHAALTLRDDINASLIKHARIPADMLSAELVEQT